MDRAHPALVSMKTSTAAGVALVFMLTITLVNLRARAQPPTMLWVWHRAQDLRGLGDSAGVAYLARTVTIRAGDETVVLPRRSGIELDPETERWAVVHVELRRGARLSDGADSVLSAIVSAAAEPFITTVQVDFDCPRSMRAAYAALLREARARLSTTQSLSITALGSWCDRDRWLADVPVDRIVPMLFGPGHEIEVLHARVRSGAPLREPRCRDSWGIRAGDEMLRWPPTVFVFPGARWTPSSAAAEAARIRDRRAHGP